MYILFLNFYMCPRLSGLCSEIDRLYTIYSLKPKLSLRYFLNHIIELNRLNLFIEFLFKLLLIPDAQKPLFRFNEFIHIKGYRYKLLASICRNLLIHDRC